MAPSSPTITMKGVVAVHGGNAQTHDCVDDLQMHQWPLIRNLLSFGSMRKKLTAATLGDIGCQCEMLVCVVWCVCVFVRLCVCAVCVCVCMCVVCVFVFGDQTQKT